MRWKGTTGTHRNLLMDNCGDAVSVKYVTARCYSNSTSIFQLILDTIPANLANETIHVFYCNINETKIKEMWKLLIVVE